MTLFKRLLYLPALVGRAPVEAVSDPARVAAVQVGGVTVTHNHPEAPLRHSSDCGVLAVTSICPHLDCVDIWGRRIAKSTNC
mgnify:FL=1